LLLLIFEPSCHVFDATLGVNKGLDKSIAQRLTYVFKTRKQLMLLLEEEIETIIDVFYRQGEFK
jgi:hypothetical protein